MSQDISSDQDALAQESDTSSVSTENQTQSSDLSNNNLTQEGQLQVIRKEIDEIKNIVYQESHSIERVERRLECSGPLPHPEILDGYDKVLHGSANRILKMAEKQLDHRISIENKLVDGENQSRLLGLVAGFLIATLGLGGAVYLGYNGKTWESGIMSGGTLVGLVTVFVKGSSNNNQEKEKIIPSQDDIKS
jgi:uncharacterized membrane protein